MDLRLALHELEATHGLDAPTARRLHDIAGLGAEPAALARRLPLGLAVLAAALLGLGLIFWIAANWDTLGRFGRFAVLQGAIAAVGLGALLRPAWRAPLALLVLLATGALFAYFGQTYQTGADPWQLFALWAALTLPLALALRSDLLWTPWVLVAFVGIALWIHAHAGHRWRIEPDDLAVHLVGWAAAGALVLAMSPLAQRLTGAGAWALRGAVTLAVIVVTGTALMALFSTPVAAHYAAGLLVLAVLAAAFVPRAGFDVYALSAAALGLNTLIVAGLGRLLFEDARGDPIGRLFLLGALAAVLLALTVSRVLKLARSCANPEASA
ncbi:DUF2157 domain-containing protein [Piscinibacter sp.]|uniref:DUF2157 domain-containing protein n=1 Tax=Piscinibacter sp. TaxID=1903157 RepID=UPI0039E2C6B7